MNMANDLNTSEILVSKLIASSSNDKDPVILVCNLSQSNDNLADRLGSDTFLHIANTKDKKVVIDGDLTVSGNLNPMLGIPIGDVNNEIFNDGLFEHWDKNTTVGHAIKEINSVLKCLAPARPPNLSKINCDTVGTTAKMTMDDAYIFGSYITFDNQQLNQLYKPSFSANKTALGVIKFGETIRGDLAHNISIGPGSPYPSYSERCFNKGNIGKLKLLLNNQLLREVDLTTAEEVSDLETGFTLSSPKNVVFASSGMEFSGFKYRTGSWKISPKDQKHGYNLVKVVHELDRNNSFITNEIEWFNDAGGLPVVFVNEEINSFVPNGFKYLSGVKYCLGGVMRYCVTASNMYSGGTFSTGIIDYLNTYGIREIPSEVVPNTGGGRFYELKVNKPLIFHASQIRLIGASVTVNMTVPNVFSPPTSSIGGTISNLLIDNVPASSTDNYETFTTEKYRLPSNLDFTSKDLDINSWDSTISINDNSLDGYKDGLQVGEGKLFVPSRNYSLLTNGFNEELDYSCNIGDKQRTFYRLFSNKTSSANFLMNIQGYGVNFIPSKNKFTASNQMKVEFIVPKQTGWMCAYDDFVGGMWNNGNGARAASLGEGRELNINWGLTIGIRNTGYSNNKVYLKITVPSDFTGYLTSINFNFV